MVEFYEISNTLYAGVMYFPYEGDATNMKSQNQRTNFSSKKMSFKVCEEPHILNQFHSLIAKQITYIYISNH